MQWLPGKGKGVANTDTLCGSLYVMIINELGPYSLMLRPKILTCKQPEGEYILDFNDGTHDTPTESCKGCGKY